MYYLIGEKACCRSIMSACGISKSSNKIPAASELKKAYADFLKKYQPNIPVHTGLETKIVANRSIEDKLIDTFKQPSILDDLERYTDVDFLQNEGEYRPQIQQEVKYLRSLFKEYRSLDPDFWSMFQMVINYIICPFSKYSNGGSDSNFIGMLFICSPSEIDEVDLYELLIHEFTHNAMFLDEIKTPHYISDELLVDTRNYGLASISAMRRPLDKVLHSVVISTEILLHREKTLGNNDKTSIHPPTKKLISNIGKSIKSVRALKNYDKVMDRRGKELLSICEETLSSF